MNWQPIETAPKDGTYIMLGGGSMGYIVEIGVWAKSYPYAEECFCVANGYEGSMDCKVSPTHWMPLPKPPTENNQDEPR